MECLRHILLFAILLATQTSDAAECESGWAQYKDELCIQAIRTDFVTFDEAKKVCSSQGPSASLLMVKEPELQEFLTSYTNQTYDNLWLGAKNQNNTGQFKWIDGEPLTYTNWADGFPRLTNDTESCIYLRPANTKMSTDAVWEDSSCQRRNLAICQKTLGWSLQDAVQEIIRIQNELNTTREELRVTKTELNAELNRTKTELKHEIEEVNNRVIPVGSLYIEYYNQTSPADLWPSLSWQDITSTYAGLFFRAMGAGSEGWGTTQSACAPRIKQTEGRVGSGTYPNPLTIPEDGWSGWGVSGYNSDLSHVDVTRFYTAGCEVRPANQAVRIWKRTN